MIQTHHTSTRIELVEWYPEENNMLKVFFKRGGTYQYDNVDPEDYGAMITNPSVGKGFNQNIRNKYTGIKI